MAVGSALISNGVDSLMITGTPGSSVLNVGWREAFAGCIGDVDDVDGEGGIVDGYDYASDQHCGIVLIELCASSRFLRKHRFPKLIMMNPQTEK